jgi:hypothetical protein
LHFGQQSVVPGIALAALVARRARRFGGRRISRLTGTRHRRSPERRENGVCRKNPDPLLGRAKPFRLRPVEESNPGDLCPVIPGIESTPGRSRSPGSGSSWCRAAMERAGRRRGRRPALCVARTIVPSKPSRCDIGHMQRTSPVGPSGGPGMSRAAVSIVPKDWPRASNLAEAFSVSRAPLRHPNLDPSGPRRS